MTTLIPSDNAIRIKAPVQSGPIVVPSPVRPITVTAPPSPSLGLLVPVTGPPGPPGESQLDLPDLTLLFENGLI